MIACSDPKAQYLAKRDAIDAAIARVLHAGQYILGREVEAFESEFAAYLGVREAVGVANGTDALHLVLRAFGIGVGDEVITTAHTAVATVAAIELAGATPVLADIEPDHFTLSPESAEERISPRTRAIIPVHIYGQSADLSRLLPLAREAGIRLIEDCAQCHGATWEGSRLGSLGDAACFSCYPTKNLGASGDGGVIVTNDPELADRCRALRQYGWDGARVSQTPGLNSRLDELQAAVLRVKLRDLDTDNALRASLADRYGNSLDKLQYERPALRPGATHVYHLYVIRARRRNELQEHLRRHGVHAGVHYPVPVHLQPAYAGRLRGGPLPETVRAANEVLSLPMYPELGESDVEAVVAAMEHFS